MIFNTHEPPPPFADFVESIFHFKDFQPDHSIERVVPTGHLFILFELDGMQRTTFDSETLTPIDTFKNAWVSGLHHNHLTISAHERSEMFVIQFKSYGARPFLKLDMDTLSNRVVAGDQLLGVGLIETRERLHAASTSDEKFDVADRWLKTHFDQTLAPPRSLIDAATALQHDPTQKLSDLTEAFDGSQKHLISQFKKFIGITPKQYQRVLRFNSIFGQLQGDQFLSWSDIALTCGYADQSHFIREFKAFSGFIPESFLQEGFDEEAPNFFPLDRDES